MKHQGMMTVGSDRTYDGMDPLAEIYYQASTFAYLENSPMGRIDPVGRAWAPATNADRANYIDQFKRFSTFKDFGLPSGHAIPFERSKLDLIDIITV